ncbi:MAG: hypothetical protein CVV23_10945 [Ignavibacteriae bacterium HGW-Ignavibacteriae-2]|jgi:hypothetical protein|nr:MAG: hypothetical protein CVV23_10945 [Ignavibacteriae bacterium HGW-Ignavibacteriae-2]
MKNILKLSFLIIMIFAVDIFSQNPNDALRLSEPGILSSAKTLGVGNAGLAMGVDFGSGLINPANFALYKKSSFTGGFFYNNFSNNVTFFGQKSDYSNSSNHLSQFGLVVPLPTQRGSMVLAAGYTRIKDFNSSVKFDGFNPGNNSMIQDLTWANDDIAYDLKLSTGVFEGENWLYDETIINGKLNQSGSIIDKGGIDNWNFSGAVEIAKNLFVGASFNIYSGSFQRDREYFEDDVDNNYTQPTNPRYPTEDFQSFTFIESLEWDLSAWDMKFGLLYKMNRFAQFGASIKLPTYYTINEKYYVEAYSDFATKSYEIDPYDSRIEYDITTPFELTGGFSYAIAGVSLGAQLTLIDYTQMEFSDGLTASLRSSNNRTIKDNFRSVLAYNLGAEYKVPFAGINLRAGFMMKPSAYEGDPSDYDKKYITAGLGIVAANVLAIDFVYAHGWWKSIGDNYGFDESRTNQDITRDNIIISFTYGI